MFVLSGRRAYIPPVPGKLRFRRGERKPIETRGTCALKRARASTKPPLAKIDNVLVVAATAG
jgi:hypothetical protein